MSTALEAIAARHLGAEVLGVSIASNPAAGLSPEPINHQDVLAATQGSAAASASCCRRCSPRVAPPGRGRAVTAGATS